MQVAKIPAVRRYVVTADAPNSNCNAAILYLTIEAQQPDIETLARSLRAAGHANVTTRVWTSRQRKERRNGRWHWFAGFVDCKF
jgi:hypothetical protein